MKKILKLMTILVAVFFVGLKGVKADGLTVAQSFVDNVWSFHYRNGEVWTYGNLPYNSINGKLVYCIQPDARVTSSNYSVYTDFTMSGFSEEEKQRMELIAYYGYGYGDNRTVKYYMATQELLWLMTSDERIKWTVGNTDDTEEIDVSAEKNEINRLISKHNVLPSFVNTNQYPIVGEEIELVDTNEVLDNYKITARGDVSFRTEGNKLYFTANKVGGYSLTFSPKYTNYYGTDKTYIYDDFSTRTQTLASFTKPALSNGGFMIYSNANVEINKKDKDTNETITSEGIKVKIKNEDSEEYVGDEYEFVNGKINIPLPTGNYSIEEITSVTPYSLNTEKLSFQIEKEDLTKSIDLFNEKIKCLITYITMSGNEKIDVKFNVYDKNYNLVYSGKTVNGVASIELTYGDYIIKEIEVPDGYVLNDKEIKFSVNDNTCKSSISVNNDKVTIPITSTENNIGYLFILLTNTLGYVFIKKVS